MTAERFGIVNDPEDADVAVLLYDGEPIGTIVKDACAWESPDVRLRFVTAGLHVKGPDLLDPVERDASFSGTTDSRFSPGEYAVWKDRLGLGSGDDR